MFGPRVKIVEHGRVGLKKKRLTRPHLVQTASSPSFVNDCLQAMGLTGWRTLRTGGALPVLNAYVESPAGNVWKIVYGTIDANMVFLIETENARGAVGPESHAIRSGLELTHGFL